MTTADQGHRLVPHTADTIVEAWGPDEGACLAEAVLGLVSAFAAVPPAVATRAVPLTVDAPDLGELLVGVLEEVVFRLDVAGTVPARATLHVSSGLHVPSGERGLRATGTLEVCDVEHVELVGAVPKAVARSGLHVAEAGGVWLARVTIDV